MALITHKQEAFSPGCTQSKTLEFEMGKKISSKKRPPAGGLKDQLIAGYRD